MDEKLEQALEERKRLREVYNTIADCWSHLRANPWPEAVSFASEIEGGTVLDIGCSNGRNLLPFSKKNVKCIGMDFSKNMIREAKKFLAKKGVKSYLVIADVLEIPFKEKMFDAIIFSRALHHIPTKQLRIYTLKKVSNLLKTKGRILITVWRRYYPKFIQDYLSSVLDKKFEFGDTYKKWTYKGKVYKRFFHLYKKEEFREELINSGLRIDKLYVNGTTLIAVCEQS